MKQESREGGQRTLSLVDKKLGEKGKEGDHP